MNLPLKTIPSEGRPDSCDGIVRSQKTLEILLGSGLFCIFGAVMWVWQSMAFALPFFVLAMLNAISRLSVLYLKPSRLSGWLGLSATIWVLGGVVWFYFSFGWFVPFLIAPIVLGLILLAVN